MLPYEIIVRGYMFGSMWEEYKTSKTFCGQKMKGEYKLEQKLAEPIVTSSAKNSMEQVIERIVAGVSHCAKLQYALSLDIIDAGSENFG